MLRRLVILFALSTAVLWASAASASKPADSKIRAAVADLKRYEAEASRLSPSRKASAKRLLKLLDLTAGRLKESKKKKHPSWVAANKRLAALRRNLRRLVSGKNVRKRRRADGKNDDDDRSAKKKSRRKKKSSSKVTPTPVPTPAPTPKSKPSPPAAEAEPTDRDSEIVARQKQIDTLARGQGGPDIALPLIEVEAPKEVPLGEAARVSGIVGDDGSPPRLKINGEPATLFRLGAGDVAIAKHSLVFRIDVPTEKAGPQRFVLEACDATGNCVGEEVVVRIGGVNRPSIDGRNFALVIGNDTYRDMPDLKTAANDAKALADMLVERYDFEAEDVQLLLDADRNDILGAIEALRNELDVDDRLVIYYAGHGQIDQASGEGFWLPVDAVADKTFTWIANDDIRRQLKGLPARHVLVIADSCFSGSLTRSAPANQQIPEDRYFTEIDSHWSRKVISSGGTEPVADSGSGGHSVFAHYLLKTLASNDRPYVTTSELFGRFVRAVANNSDQKPEFGTIAKAGDEGGGDFTFILR